MKTKEPLIILASESPYRKKLLLDMGLPFLALAPKIDEDSYKNKGLSALDLTRTLAQMKAQSLKEQYPNHLIIGSDQVLEFEGQIFGKPHTPERALEQLKIFQGRTHRLITSMTVIHQEDTFLHTDITRLTMWPLTESQIRKYIEIDKPLDCAGSYKIENAGISLFQKIDTEDHSAIMGLPLLALSRVLRKKGIL